MKKISIFISLLILTLSGCTKMLWEENSVMQSRIKEKSNISDNIIASFKYTDILIKDNSSGKKVNISKLPNDGYGFLGEKYAYILSEGSKELMELNELVKSIPLSTFDNPNGIIRLKLEPGKENDKLIEFSDYYYIYTKENITLTTNEIDKLKNLGFKETIYHGKKSFQKRIDLQGYLFDKEKLNIINKPENNLTYKYKVEFYSTEKYKAFNVGNLLENIAATPFTIVSDVFVVPAATIVVMYFIANKKT